MKINDDERNFEKVVLFPVGNFPVEMHISFTSFLQESPVLGYPHRNFQGVTITPKNGVKILGTG